jgi:seryl-tRNA synthetase
MMNRTSVEPTRKLIRRLCERLKKPRKLKDPSSDRLTGLREIRRISGLTADKKSKHKQVAQQQPQQRQQQQQLQPVLISASTLEFPTAPAAVDDDEVEEVSPSVAEIIRNEVGTCIDLFLDERVSEENDLKAADKGRAF